MATLPLLAAILTALPNQWRAEPLCRTHPSPLDWPQITCEHVTSADDSFRRIELNRTHWIRCLRCCLVVLDENTFDIPKNNISYLDLQANRVEIVKKNAFGKLFLLKMLNLKNNRIDLLDSGCFLGLKRLLHLDLSWNKLKILTNNLFSDLNNLDLLNLSGNRIFLIQSHAFFGLNNLKYLNLKNNCLSDRLEEKSFDFLRNLKLLNLDFNNLSSLHQNAFADLPNLNYLYLNNNSIQYLVQYNFKSLNNLVDLQLRFNRLEEIQISSFNGLRSLKTLHLSDNNISLIKPYGFIGLDSLIVLDLVRNSLNQIYFSYFDKIPKLILLWLNENNIEQFLVEDRDDEMDYLQFIDLSENRLSKFDYALLQRKLTSLREISLINNTFGCGFFTEMYGFYLEGNVSVCVSARCHANDTLDYFRSICTKDFYEIDQDLATTTENFTVKNNSCGISLLLFSNFTFSFLVLSQILIGL